MLFSILLQLYLPWSDFMNNLNFLKKMLHLRRMALWFVYKPIHFGLSLCFSLQTLPLKKIVQRPKSSGGHGATRYKANYKSAAILTFYSDEKSFKASIEMQRCQQAIARVLYLWTEHWMSSGWISVYISTQNSLVDTGFKYPAIALRWECPAVKNKLGSVTKREGDASGQSSLQILSWPIPFFPSPPVVKIQILTNFCSEITAILW